MADQQDRDHDVVIAGGGPTGMMLAAELALAGVDVAIVERRADQKLAGSRAGGLHARTLEVLDQRGVVERFLAQGRPTQVATFAGTPLDISDFPTRHNYGLALWQERDRAILADWIAELAVPILSRPRGHAASRRTPPASTSRCPTARALRRAVPRRLRRRPQRRPQAAGIGFPGWDRR